MFGTVETWLIWKLTCGKVHVTDYSNASRTMLFNIHTLDWDDDILKLLDIPRSVLPKPVSNSEFYGYADPMHFCGAIKIAGAAGDQQAALFGQTCFNKGEAKNTYGTGGFLLMNTGDHPVRQQKRPADYHRLGAERPGELCAGRFHLRGRCSHPMAAGRAEDFGGQPRLRVHGPQGAGHQRLLRGARLHRSGRPPLGPVRPRHHRRPDPRLQQKPYHPRHTGQPVLSGQRRAGRHEC